MWRRLTNLISRDRDHHRSPSSWKDARPIRNRPKVSAPEFGIEFDAPGLGTAELPVLELPIPELPELMDLPDPPYELDLQWLPESPEEIDPTATKRWTMRSSNPSPKPPRYSRRRSRP